MNPFCLSCPEQSPEKLLPAYYIAVRVIMESSLQYYNFTFVHCALKSDLGLNKNTHAFLLTTRQSSRTSFFVYGNFSEDRMFFSNNNHRTQKINPYCGGLQLYLCTSRNLEGAFKHSTCVSADVNYLITFTTKANLGILVSWTAKAKRVKKAIIVIQETEKKCSFSRCCVTDGINFKALTCP